MTAAMHRDFMDLAIRNALTQPGESRMLGTDLDLGKIDTDNYVVAGIADHLCKWQSCYQTTQLLGGQSKFVLSTSGHIAAMVNPPGNEKASFQTASSNPADAQEWLSSAGKVKGSWWDDYVEWLAERTGPERNKPSRDRLGGVRADLRRSGDLCPRPLAATGCAPSRCAACRRGSRCAQPRGRLVDEPPLLLCNGIGASLEALQPLVDALDPDRGVVRFDVPGVGGSAGPAVPLPDRGALLLGDRPDGAGSATASFDVLGLSWGGGLAQQLAVQSRRRVRRVVLVATGTGALMVPAHPRVLAKMLTPRRHRDPEYAAPHRSRDLRRHHAHRPRAVGADLLHATTRAGPKRGYYFQLAAMTGWSSLPFLGLVRQPTLVMGGDDDPIIPVVNPRMQAAPDPPIAAAHLPRRPPGHPDRGRRARPRHRSLSRTRSTHERPGGPRARGLTLLRLPRLRAAAGGARTASCSATCAPS